ncbi:hypothetical protein EYF80_004794 [Liparis tanakae]|uniref:Uncharacterized protein n=1 Tax=Liparis tanakae TaxID=230148 RepID=A0A4Z2J3E5_9TELE|nr:hypothetical protein EYF80_004794 [Liparis tanakae]
MSLLASDEGQRANPSVPPSHLRPNLLRRGHWLACLFRRALPAIPLHSRPVWLLWACERSIRYFQHNSTRASSEARDAEWASVFGSGFIRYQESRWLEVRSA